MRKLTEPQAHRARAAIIDGNYPKDLQARCGWCRSVLPVKKGEFVDLPRKGAGPSRAFKCSDCIARERGSAA
jgi:hypothetical protein